MFGWCGDEPSRRRTATARRLAWVTWSRLWTKSDERDELACGGGNAQGGVASRPKVMSTRRQDSLNADATGEFNEHANDGRGLPARGGHCAGDPAHQSAARRRTGGGSRQDRRAWQAAVGGRHAGVAVPATCARPTASVGRGALPDGRSGGAELCRASGSATRPSSGRCGCWRIAGVVELGCIDSVSTRHPVRRVLNRQKRQSNRGGGSAG